ncbi:hypothetical protein MUK42_36521 [Musa troglodytarum]|uniref:Uncharacterized protein n=1 Tax=Musa troglodytarum TaxID=320322 RepID=A0A9E7EE13_9LILI|nr:hypothetical protein MUK42_36521 [Musa troglodytarum]
MVLRVVVVMVVSYNNMAVNLSMSIRTLTMRRKRRQSDEASASTPEEEKEGAEAFVSMLHRLVSSSSSDYSAFVSTSKEEYEVGKAAQIQSINLETLAKMAIPNSKANRNAMIHHFFVVSLVDPLSLSAFILSPPP